jgi:hypothetical protein
MFSVTAVETGKTSGRMILISMQVHDGKNAVVHQEIVERQSFEPGQSRAYAFAWTPDGPGTYTVQVGAFGEDFSPRFGWEKRAAVVVVEGEAR